MKYWKNFKKLSKKKKIEKKVIYQTTFLRYSFLQGSSENILLNHNKHSFLEAFNLAYVEAATKS